MYRSAFAEVDITPSLGLPIPGYFEPRISDGVLDPLFVKAWVIEGNGNTAALAAVDAIGIERGEVKRIRERVAHLTEIPGEAVMIAATHSHTAGPTYVQPEYRDEAYLDTLVEHTAQAIKSAWVNLQPVHLCFGMGKLTDVSFNRRYFMRDGAYRTNPGIKNPDIVKPAGPIDPDVPVLQVDDLDGNPIGFVLNFACHLDTVSGARYSADYPGQLAKRIKTKYGPQTVSLFTTGACGDINHINVAADKQKRADEIGDLLADTVLAAVDRMKTATATGTEPAAVVETSSRSWMSEVRRPTAEQLQEAHATLKRAEEEGNAVSKTERHFARQIVLLEESGETTAETEVQVFRIGPWAIVAVPCELFVELGLEIKRRSLAAATFVQGYSNAVLGYVPTRKAFDEGGYETLLTSRSRLAIGSGERMVEETLQIVEQLFSS